MWSFMGSLLIHEVSQQDGDVHLCFLLQHLAVLFMIFIIKMKTLVGPCGGDGMEGEGCRRNSQANINNNNNNNSKATIFIKQ